MTESRSGEQSKVPQSNHNQQRLQLIQATTEFSGPLPPPAILEHYNRIVPGAAERILVMAEEQSRHRRTLETKVITSDVLNAKLGLIFGFILGLLVISGGVLLARNDQPVVGTIFGSVYLVALVGTFVYGSRLRMKERQERQRG